MKKFDLSLKWMGFPIVEARKKLSQLHSLSSEELHKFNETKRWENFKFHFDNNPDYRAFIKSEPAYWRDIPILTKRSIQKPLVDRFTQGYSKDNTHLHNTSGSSGEPFYFAKDKFCHAMTWAVIMDRFAKHGIDFNTSLQARFYGIPMNTRIKYYKEKLKDFVSERERFPVFNLSDEVLEAYAERFKRRKFTYLNGYTSSLVLFAEYLNKQGRVLRKECPTLQRCVVTSEICDDIDRAKLEKGFGVPVVNEYGAAELDLVAFEDEEFNWVLNDDTLYVEVVDDEGLPLPDGTEGRIIITSLFNRAMPFIRYDVGDIGIIDPERVNGKRILKKLIGRTNDVATLPSGKRIPGLTFYYVSKSFLEKSGAMKEFIIKQKTPSHFHFEYVSEEELSKSDLDEINRLMDIYLETGLEATFERKNNLGRTRAGKLKHFTVEVE